MAGHAQPLLVMIHGVSSAGPWYDDLRAVVTPFLCCRGVRYRAYHCFGPLKVFFWPWALFLGMILISCGMSVAVELGGVGDARIWYPWLLLLGGAEESIRTRGLTRGVPWALAAAWSLTCYRGGWNPTILLHVLLCTATAWVVWCELEWPQRAAIRTRAIGWTVGISLLGWVLWWLDAPEGDLPLWAAVVGQMVLLELRESHGGDQITSTWRTAMLLAWPTLGVGAWLLIESAPALGLLVALALLALGQFEPHFRVWRTLECVHRLLDRARHGHHGQIHLIGHSLGTFLSGRHFESYPGKWDRLVLVGGVISEVYDWSLLLNARNHLSRIQDVRNEHGGLDVVVRAIRYAGRWAHRQRLGTAGWRGLRPEPPLVAHDVPDPYNVCPHCPPTTRLHNFYFRDYMHSTYFFTRTHMRDFWLPYFLGYVPSEYAYFRKLCVTGADLLRNNRQADFERIVAAELRSIDWHWDQADGRKLDEAVKGNLGALLPDLDRQFPSHDPLPSAEILDIVPRVLCQLVDKAIDAQDNGTGPDRLKEMVNPPAAIAQVAQAALQDMRTKLGLP